MWQMGSINFIVDLTVINLTQLASRGVSRHLAGSIAANHNGQMGDIFHFWWLRLKPIIFSCLCECLTHWIISLINKTSLPRHNVFGSRCGMKPSVSVERGSLPGTPCVHVLGEILLFCVFTCWDNSYCFLSSNIVTDNGINLSLMLRALIPINLATSHHVFSTCRLLSFTSNPSLLFFRSCFHISLPIVHLPVCCLIDLPFTLHHFFFSF